MILVNAIERVKNAIEAEPGTNWIVAFSGGKDSSIVLKLFWTAFCQLKPVDELSVVYCDTGSENPLSHKLALSTLNRLSEEAVEEGIRFRADVVTPEVRRRLLVRIVGRGYPPPNTFFRWCTKDMRIRPVEAYMASRSSNDVVVLGVRGGESLQRDRSFKLTSDNMYWSQQKESKYKQRLFLPISDFSLEDVWDGLHWLPKPKCVNARDLWALYEKASGECPIIRAPNSPPCGGGRFGCWLCTVVRKDRAAEHLIQSGYKELEPLLAFRSWLLAIRNDPIYRCTIRRSGRIGLGPFRLSARKEIFERVLDAESESGIRLLNAEELKEIRAEWQRDEGDLTYLED